MTNIDSNINIKDEFNSHRFCVAPMLDKTDKHARYLFRLLSKKALLYTEMVHVNAILRGDTHRHLSYNDVEHPIAVQLGGSNLIDLANAGKIAESFLYDEINLNIGCPSDKVQSGNFGACLMKEPQLVVDMINVVQKEVKTPVTIKIRIGIDEYDSEEYLHKFISKITHETDISSVLVHARKAWLKGLSPKQNRTIPPLRYDVVYRLKRSFPKLNIVINGGIYQWESIYEHLKYTDGVMLGRSVYRNPLLLAQVDKNLFGIDSEVLALSHIFSKLLLYAQDQIENHGVKLHHITRHWMGLSMGHINSKKMRQAITHSSHLSELNENIFSLL